MSKFGMSRTISERSDMISGMAPSAVVTAVGMSRLMGASSADGTFRISSTRCW